MPRPLLGLVLLAAVVWAPPSAHAGEVRLQRVSLKETKKGDAVTVAGSVTAPAEVADPATVRVVCGTFEQTLESPALARKGKVLRYKPPRGTKSGVRKFSLSLRNGKFTLAVQRADVGPFDVPVTLSLDVGGQWLRALVPLNLSKKGTSGSWRKGRPLQARVAGRVLQVGSAAGNTVLAPLQDAAFVRDDDGTPPAQQTTIVGGTPATDADGRFEVVVEFTDPAVLGRVDIGNLLGEADSRTRPGTVVPTQSDRGLEVVCFVQRQSGIGGTVTPGAPSTFDVPGGMGAPSGTLAVPAGAVPAGVTKAATTPEITFTPYVMAAELPAPVPDGYVALAGAEVTSTAHVVFDPAHRPTVELSRPSWTEAGPLATADIRLLQWIDDRWQEQPGRGFYDQAADRIVPDPFDPAGLAETAPVVWAAAVAGATSGTVLGHVVDAGGGDVAGVTVLTRNGGVVTGADGGFAVPASTLSPDGLEVVQVVGDASTSAVVVSAAQASEGGLIVGEADPTPPAWTVGVVQGSVTDAGTGQPVEGATVTLSLAGMVRSLLHDDGGTPANFADDTFSVPNLAVLGVLTHEWALFLPGDAQPFVSSLYVRNTVSPTLLMLEAQAAGRGVPDGAYTVRVRYTIPYLGQRELFGGFRVTTVGLDLTVSDIQLPAGWEVSPSVTATTDAQGLYSKFYRAPEGIPMTAGGLCPGGNATNTRSFVFGSLVTVDLETDGPKAPDTIAVGWNVLAPVPETRNYAALVPLGGKLYSFAHNLNRTVYRYDPAANAWSAMTSMNALHQTGKGAAVGGRVWVVGGRDQASVESYDPGLNTWTTRASMTFAREEGGAGVVNGTIVALGGCKEHWENVQFDDTLALDHVEQYDPTSNTWSPLAPLPTGIVFPRIAVVDGILYAVGGWRVDAHAYSREVLAYAPQTDTWTARSPMPTLLYRGACAVIDGEIYYVGGNTAGSGRAATMYVYDPATDAWRRGPDMPATRVYHGAASAGGVLYVVGGVDGGDNLSVWAYRPR